MTAQEVEPFLKKPFSVQTEFDKKFFNFNLNQNHKCSILPSPVHSFSKSNYEKQFATNVVLDDTVSDNFRTRDNTTTKKLVFKAVKNSNSCDESKEEKQLLPRWKKKSSNANNSSTLSLHISAYENNSIDSSSSDANESLPKKFVKEKFIDSSSNFQQNSFEFPRQMNGNEPNSPEIMQFTASQKLLLPNQNPSRQSGPSTMSKLPSKINPISTCTRILISYSSTSNEFITELVHGKIMEKLGVHIIDGRYKLLPEECVYLVALRQAFCYANCNPIEAYEEGKEPMSMAKLYSMLTENSISLLRFSIFSSLLTAGYTVKPAKESNIPESSTDEESLMYDYDVWHFAVPWTRNDLSPPPPTYRLIVADFRYQNQLPPRHQLSKLSLNGSGTVVIGAGAVGTYSFFSIHGMPVNLEI